MERYAPKFMELAPRDITARSIQTEINEGRGIDGKDYVYLDLRHLGEEKIAEKLPGIRDLAIHFEGVDPIDASRCRSCPASTTPWAASTPTSTAPRPMPGLYAAGECACVSVHGANRLGGNSLLETIVFGRRAGRAVVAYLSAATAPSAADARRREAARRRAGARRPARARDGQRGRLRHPRRDDRHHEDALRRLPRGPPMQAGSRSCSP